MALPSSTGDLKGAAAQAVDKDLKTAAAGAASASQAMDFLGAQKKQTISSQSISKASKIKVLVHGKTRFAQQAKREKEKIQIQTEKVSKMNITEAHNTANAKTQQEKDEATQSITAAEPPIDSNEHLLAESASNQQIEGADQQDEQQREDAAVKIQKVHRGNAGLQQVSEVRVLQEKKNEAATKIQSLERGRQCRQQLAAEQEEQQQHKEFAESASNQQIGGADQQAEQEREDAAVKIQKVHRGNAGRQQVSEVRVLQEKKNEAATKIQSLERGRQCRQQLAAEQEEQQQHKEFAESASNQQIGGADQQAEQEREDAAVKIQKVHRGNAGRQQVSEVRVLQEKKNEAATKIQSLERGRQCRQQLAAEQEEQQQHKEFAESASNQQIGGADQQAEQEREDAAVKIQKVHRVMLVDSKFRKCGFCRKRRTKLQQRSNRWREGGNAVSNLLQSKRSSNSKKNLQKVLQISR